MSIVKASTVERGSIPEFIRFYNAMLSGEPHGYFEMTNVKGWYLLLVFRKVFHDLPDKRIRFVFS